LLPHVKYLPQRSLRGVAPVPIGAAGAWLGYSVYLNNCELADGRYQDEYRGENGIWDEVIVRYGGIRPLESEFGAWGRELHKRWEGSAGQGTEQDLGKPGPGVAAFFAHKLYDLRGSRDEHPLEMRLKALCLDEFKEHTRKIGKEDFPLFQIKLWVDPPAPLPRDETEARTHGLRADDWVEYHLHPYRNGIRRRANRGDKGDFSLIIFTRDDYWVDASLRGGRRLAGDWLSKLLENPPKSLTDCARKLWTGYDPDRPPPLAVLDGDGFDREFESELTRAPDDQPAAPEAEIPESPYKASDPPPPTGRP
jgi:hypothetical protein